VPRLRFTRDDRGYEHTFLVHTSGRRGRDRSRILYWFRSPPAVRVGRPALDPAAIRAIEDANPGIAFDWPAILEARPVETEPVEGWRARRARPTRLREARDHPPDEMVTPSVVPPPHRGTEDTGGGGDPAGKGHAIESATSAPTFDADAPESDGQSQHLERSAVQRALGSEGLVRVRARYAEVLARISSQVTDAAVADELRVLAERLNPDAWVTDEEVRRGLESFEPVLETVRQRLGRPRRRSARSEANPPLRSVAGQSIDDLSGAASSPADAHRPPD
jgi:hypothetical protein